MKDDSLEINILASNKCFISQKETSSKMASTLRQQWLTIFCQKAQNYVYLGPYEFVQFSLVYGLNTY